MNAKPDLEAPDDDPFLWLEQIDGKQALAWIDEQNEITLGRFGDAVFTKDWDTLTAILNRQDRIPFIMRRGDKLYNFWTDASNPRGLWRRTTLDRFRTGAPEWETLLDIDALADAEGEDWIWQGAATLPGSHDRAMVRLSRGGGDAVVLREYDLATGGFVENGFALPEAKGGVGWLDRDTLLVSSALGEDRATISGYARTVRIWRRGEPIAQARTVCQISPEMMSVSAFCDRTRDQETVWYLERYGFFSVGVRLGDRNGPKKTLELPREIWFDSEGDWAAVMPRKPWAPMGVSYAPGTLLGMRISAFLDGDREFSVLFEPGPRRALQGFFWSNGRLVLSILDRLKPLHQVLTPSDKGWTLGALPELPQTGVVSVSRLDMGANESDGTLLVNAQDPITPPALALIEPGNAPQILRRAPAVFDAAELAISEYEAVSFDGERIPYMQVGPVEQTGDAPVHMSGYGGFQISSQPYYNASIGKLWLERGGTGVIAQIRGGGEYGPAWHEAGRREGKRRSHDDFAAVAADLVARGITRPGRIAAEGGSNGGLLIANMLTRYPDRFGALFCTIPLIDMRRYSKLLAGASWIAEYGDPDKPEDWAFLQHISAYHTAAPGQAYPPILLATARRDDRVHPGHARKMAAKLQAMGYRAYFYEPAAGGHGYGKDNRERARFTALGYRFLRESIGWFPENDDTATTC